MDSGRFDVIIADLSTCLTDASNAIIEAAERICVTAKAGEPGARERSYMGQLAGSCGQDIGSRVVRSVLSRAEGGVTDIGAPLEGEFGKEISKLTEKLINMVE